MLNATDLSGVITAANVAELLWDDARGLLFYTTTDGHLKSWDPNTGSVVDDISAPLGLLVEPLEWIGGMDLPPPPQLSTEFFPIIDSVLED